MAKLFTGGPPDYTVQIKQELVTGVPASLDDATFNLSSMHIVNTSGAKRLVTITDGEDDKILDAQEIPPHGLYQPPAFNLMPCPDGLKGGANGAGVIFRGWGWRPV